MATTYKSDLITQGAPIVAPMTGNVACVTAKFTQTAAFVINDVIQMVAVPNGYQVDEVILDSDDVDTGGSPAVLYDVGDATTAAAYISASNIGQAGGVARASAAGYLSNTPYAIATSGGNPGSTIIQVKINTAPATSTTNKTIRLSVFYHQGSGVAGAPFS